MDVFIVILIALATIMGYFLGKTVPSKTNLILKTRGILYIQKSSDKRRYLDDEKNPKMAIEWYGNPYDIEKCSLVTIDVKIVDELI